MLAKLRKSVFREETSSCRPSAVFSPCTCSSAPAIPPLSPVNNALLCICSLCLIYNSHNVCRLESPVRRPYRGMGALTKPAAICCGSLSLAPSKGLRGKCVLSIEPLPSVPPADPLSIFTQHLHIVVHDLIAERSNTVLLHTVDAVPALSCLAVTSRCKPYLPQRSRLSLVESYI